MRTLVFSAVRLFGDALSICLGENDKISEATSEYRLANLILRIEKNPPDIVLFDVANQKSIDSARRLKAACPSVHLLALALPEITERVIACADAGFIGYIPRDASMEELLIAMQKAMHDELICSPRITHALFQEMRRRQGTTKSICTSIPLTRRERQVVRELTRGYSNKGIAAELQLSEATIKNHLHNVFVKLGVHKRTEAIALLRDEPWVAESA